MTQQQKAALHDRLENISRQLAMLDELNLCTHDQLVAYDSLSIEHDAIAKQLEALYNEELTAA